MPTLIFNHRSRLISGKVASAGHARFSYFAGAVDAVVKIGEGGSG